MGAEPDLKAVGTRAAKVDGPELVTGRGIFAEDVRLPGMLYGRVLHSSHPHARILRIDASRARKLEGVIDVITSSETPGMSLFAAKEACYEGQKIAAVAAEDPDIAEDALELIRVDYEVLPAVVDPAAAMAHDAPRARLDVPPGDVTDGQGRKLPNVTAHRDFVEGDVDKAFAASDVIVEAEYETPFFHQTYIEPNVATARLEPDGRITIWTACQGIFSIRDSVAGALKMPHGRIRVIGTKIGGGFGAKNGVFVESHAALLAKRTGRPVQIVMDREEEFRDGKPAPGCLTRLKLGAKSDGAMTAIEGRIVWDGGWTGGGGAPNRLKGPYRLSNVKLEGYAVRTNKPSPGAYRAPGSPQTAFAIESTVDLLALKLGMDPVELRLKNAVGVGDPSLGGTPLPRDWFKDTLKKTAEAARWGKRRLKRHQGRGIACGEWTNGSGPSNAFITVGEDGSVSLLTGQMDINGLHTALAQIVAEELRVKPEKVTVTQGDTDMVPYTTLSAGSMAAYSAGTAARQAGQEARKRVLEVASEMLEAPIEKLELTQEGVRVIGSPDRSAALSVLAASARRTRGGPLSGQSVLGGLPTFPSYSVDIATVEVDPDTGQVRLIDLVIGQDVGRSLNPTLVEGQMQGGATQAMGFGMMEGYRYDGDGKLLNPNLLDYPIPTALDIPQIRTVIVEASSPEGPYGAKGVGEPPIIPGAAAIANAIHDAVGARVTELPTTPERVLTAIQAGAGAA